MVGDNLGGEYTKQRSSRLEMMVEDISVNEYQSYTNNNSEINQSNTGVTNLRPFDVLMMDGGGDGGWRMQGGWRWRW